MHEYEGLCGHIADLARTTRMMKINEAKLRDVIVVDNNLTRLVATLKESKGLKIPYYLKCSYLESLTLTEAVIQHWANAVATVDRDLSIVGVQRGVLAWYKDQPKGCNSLQVEDAYAVGVSPIRSLVLPETSRLSSPRLVLWGQAVWLDGNTVRWEAASVATLIKYGITEEADTPDAQRNSLAKKFNLSRWLAKRRFRALFKYAKDPAKERPRDKMRCAILDHSNNKFPVWLGHYDASNNCFDSAGGWFEYDEVDMWAELHPLTAEVTP